MFMTPCTARHSLASHPAAKPSRKTGAVSKTRTESKNPSRVETEAVLKTFEAKVP